MPDYLGIDTSNYTTSLAVYSSDDGRVRQKKRLLSVPTGQAGLRQSEALFQHTRRLPILLSELNVNESFAAVGFSARPRDAADSYMPCFLAGTAAASFFAAGAGIPLYQTSHQAGHVLAALLSAGRLDLAEAEFYAFHVSGGTTDLLLCSPDSDRLLSIEGIGGSSDLHAGQAVDRVGLMLGLDFPCGPELERLAENSDKEYNPKPSLRDGFVSLSGIENQCRRLFDSGEPKERVARYCLDYIYTSVAALCRNAMKRKSLPIVFAGGVMSNRIIRKRILEEFDAQFAAPELSCDNAVGCAVYAALSHENRG